MWLQTVLPHSMQEVKQSWACSQFDRLQVRERGLQIFHDFVLAPERLCLILRLLPDLGIRTDNINIWRDGEHNATIFSLTGGVGGSLKYTQTHTRANTEKYTPTSSRVCTHSLTNTHIHTHTHIYRHTRAHTDKYTPTHSCVCTHSCPLTHTYIDTHMHTLMNILPQTQPHA